MKNPYEESNDFPEEQVRTAIQLGIANGEAEKKLGKRHRKNSNKRTLVYALSSIAAVFVILIGFSHQSPALASNLSKIPIIGSVFGDSDLIGLKQAQEKGLTSQVGETKTINGISVTLDEVLYDQNNITIGLKMESEQELDEEYFGSGMDFIIDGKAPSGASGSYGEEILSSTSRTAIETISVTDEMPSEFDLGLLLQGENDENWYFSVPVKQANDIKQIPVQHEETVDGIQLNVTEFSYGASGTSVSFTSSEDAALADDDRDRASFIEFKIEDQDGNEIKSHSGGVKGERVKGKMIYTSNKQFDPIDSDVTEVTITPYLDLPTGGGGVEIDENGEETELEYKNDSIQPVEFKSFKVKISQ
ncbi:DUF4179 domain-containing protein [Virgibacillus sp. MSJ-26]|uniref:DUF4179 domain-containing protein n=1 Tax=Virgibacillus sp. MSJ-26 TaxID=2841522 RepID=UPI001C0FFCAC|nr:DUF4179 domain-containing protein [Virgibacillus sp. MSJ-26]MBU5465898.1 DUF4179 domain-containing protein [Virgibacillus sp. MSJ-26]